jgi:DNA-directed RNA polymerase subunit omega
MKNNKLFDELIEKIPNKYILTIVAGKRGREILSGDKPLVKTSSKSTIVNTVFKEILNEKISAGEEIIVPEESVEE